MEKTSCPSEESTGAQRRVEKPPPRYPRLRRTRRGGQGLFELVDELIFPKIKLVEDFVSKKWRMLRNNK